jgi:putative ABC transport system substrate-binding protein
MDRRCFIASIVGSLIALPMGLRAQSPGRIWRIGFLAPSVSPSKEVPFYGKGALLDGLTALGYVEGRNFVLEEKYAEGHLDRLPALANELARLPVDVIVVAGPSPLSAARAATTTIPIVMIAGSSDPVGEGVVASLARPGGNVTGLTYAVSPERFGKQLELLKEAAPRISRVAVWWDFDLALFRQTWAVPLAVAASKLGLEILEPVQVLDQAGIGSAFATMQRQRADALLVAIGGPTHGYRLQVADAALRNRLPTVSAFREFTKDGGLLSYGPNFPDVYRRGAAYVDRILKGAKPADLPVELPSKYDLVVNVKTAKALGLVIPPSILVRADDVIQ